MLSFIRCFSVPLSFFNDTNKVIVLRNSADADGYENGSIAGTYIEHSFALGQAMILFVRMEAHVLLIKKVWLGLLSRTSKGTYFGSDAVARYVCVVWYR